MNEHRNASNTTAQVRIKLRHDLLDDYDKHSDKALSYTLNILLESHLADIKAKKE
jgi:hypothetical protein